ncbi:MAG: lipoate--protein ligase family protein, partial [Chloroflexota bacterium]|nr:lipoate--protein ligase family protein [Chloroflexota bacterium]
LGVNQHVGEIDLDEVAKRGFSLVRRLTGGRAVLHQYELTYSLVARENDPRVSGGVIESYRKISAALVDALCSLGAHVQLSAPDRALFRAMSQERRYSDLARLEDTEHGAVCFDTSSAYELTAGGRKLVGSAQARRGGALLQHGSILLDIDWDAWTSVFAYATDAGRQRARSKLPQRMTSLRQEIGREVAPAEVCAAMAESFARLFNVEFSAESVKSGEKARAAVLAAEKYNSNAWTARS